MADVGDNSKAGLVSALNGALADTVALYFKTKNFHWHVAGPRFRDLHVLFDEQAAQLVGTVDDLGERVRKNDEYTLTSIGSVMKATRIEDQDDVTLTADAMVKELRDDNKKLHRMEESAVVTLVEQTDFVMEAEGGMLRNPEDDLSAMVFGKDIRGKTDRFVWKLRKPAA